MKKMKSLVKQAEEVNDVLEALGIAANTETGKQIRGTIAMELLGSKYDLMDKHSKANFVKQNSEVMLQVRQMLHEEGIMTQGKLE